MLKKIYIKINKKVKYIKKNQIISKRGCTEKDTETEALD
jgi:hypothetical protein